MGNGVIDMGYHKRRAHTLRARFLRDCVRNLVCRMVLCWRRRTTELELNALDERALHDIGILRSDISAIASGIYFRTKAADSEREGRRQ